MHMQYILYTCECIGISNKNVFFFLNLDLESSISNAKYHFGGLLVGISQISIVPYRRTIYIPFLMIKLTNYTQTTSSGVGKYD